MWFRLDRGAPALSPPASMFRMLRSVNRIAGTPLTATSTTYHYMATQALWATPGDCYVTSPAPGLEPRIPRFSPRPTSSIKPGVGMIETDGRSTTHPGVQPGPPRVCLHKFSGGELIEGYITPLQITSRVRSRPADRVPGVAPPPQTGL